MAHPTERTALAAGLAGLLAAAAGAQVVDLDAPTFDRWNYPFNATPGERDVATTFGSGFVPGMFDDRDAQFLLGFETSGAVAPGLGAQNYVVLSAQVTATIDPRFGGVFAYDPTYDSYRTHLLPGDPDFVPDADPGRPIVLSGTGFRNGFNARSFGETGPFSFDDPTLEGVRNAYAAAVDGGTLRDISNNVRDRFDFNPFAVGRAPLSPGELVPAETTFAFDLDVDDAHVQRYLAMALDEGIVSLTISSLHPAEQGGAVQYPGFMTKESLFPGAPPATLDMVVRVIPAPAAAAPLLAMGLLAGRRRR